MMTKPSSILALVVIDSAVVVTGVASAVAPLFGGPVQAGTWAAFGGTILLFWASLWEYDDEQQALIEKVLKIDKNVVTRHFTHDARTTTLILVAGLAMIGAASQVN
jgi:hypothetical protein